jgi:hypothetical protein
MRRCLIALLLSAVAVVAGCAGSSSSNSGTPPRPTPPPPGSTSSQINPPVVIGLAPGQAAAGADIVVPLASSSPAPNALVLGVSAGGGGTAFNTGATISRGASKMILMFGPGLSAGAQISISGPPDIAISHPQSITSTKGTPGVAFQVAVDPNAALGARTVLLQNAKNDISTFTGGLEVTP